MTKTLELSVETASRLEQVRRCIWISTGEHPDNNALIDRLVNVFYERVRGGP